MLRYPPSNLILGTSDAAKTLTATVSPSNATYKSIVWSSSDPTVATVDKNGNVTPVKAGTATITATSEDDNTKKGTCAVTVGKDITSEFDAAFAQVLQTKGYVADATRILDAEVANVTYLNVEKQQSLTSLKGIEYFTNLETLDISRNVNMTTLDLSKNTELTELQVGNNSLTSIDISDNTKLAHFYCKYNPGNAENNFIVKVWSSFPDTPPTNFTTGTWTKDGNTITVVYQK